MVVYVFVGCGLKGGRGGEFRPFALFKLQLVTHVMLNE